jgi:ubiquinone biosynthesis accessory factor UbiJ
VAFFIQVAFFISAAPVIESPLAAALNHVLAAEPWARERLAPFAGQTLELRAPPWPQLVFEIRDGGLLQPGAPHAEASLSILVKPDAPAALLRGEHHFLRAVEVSGNPRLAEAVMFLLRHLRWDFEEDLARVFGDVVAERMGGAVRGFAAWQADAARRLSESAAVYATQEKKLLVGRADFEPFAHEVARLRDAIERLEQKVLRRETAP